MKAYHFVVAWRVPVVQSPFGERLDHGVRDELVLVMHRGKHGWKVAGQGHALFAHQVYVKNVEPLCATSHEVAVVGLSGGGWRTVWARSDDDVTHPSAPSGEAVAFANGRLEGLAIACSECDRLTTALDYAGKEYRRPASAEQCANALRSIYAKFYRELHPDPQKLNELSGRALAAAQQHGQPAPPSTTVGVEGRYHPCTHILIEGLKRLEGGAAVLAEWDRARAKADAALAAMGGQGEDDAWCAECGVAAPD